MLVIFESVPDEKPCFSDKHYQRALGHSHDQANTYCTTHRALHPEEKNRDSRLDSKPKY